MNKLQWLISKAEHSSFYRWILNFAASRAVPFNKPHGFKIREVKRNSILIELPYKTNNLNHIRGIHACALATLCEYSTGITLLSSLDPKSYRIILKNISMTYHYQAKKKVFAKFELSDDWIQNQLINPLTKEEKIFKELQVEVYDEDQTHICTGLINWQIKHWNSVRTK